jgi:hypothetical protein
MDILSYNYEENKYFLKWENAVIKAGKTYNIANNLLIVLLAFK